MPEPLERCGFESFAILMACFGVCLASKLPLRCTAGICQRGRRAF